MTVLRLPFLCHSRSAKDVARESPFLGIFHDLLELRTELVSEPTDSKRGDGGVATNTDSSDISEHTLLRGYAPGIESMPFAALGLRESKVEK